MDSQCSPCQAGQFQDEEGQVECKVCADGKLSRYTGAAACQECPGTTHYRGDAMAPSVLYGIACQNYTALSVYPLIKPLMYVMDISNLSAYMAEHGCYGRDPEPCWCPAARSKSSPSHRLSRRLKQVQQNYGLCKICHDQYLSPPHCLRCPDGSELIGGRARPAPRVSTTTTVAHAMIVMLENFNRQATRWSVTGVGRQVFPAFRVHSILGCPPGTLKC